MDSFDVAEAVSVLTVFATVEKDSIVKELNNIETTIIVLIKFFNIFIILPLNFKNIFYLTTNVLIVQEL